MQYAYRIRRSRFGDSSWLGLVEYFELTDGPVWSCKDETPIGEDIGELVSCLERMLEAARAVAAAPELIFDPDEGDSEPEIAIAEEAQRD